MKRRAQEVEPDFSDREYWVAAVENLQDAYEHVQEAVRKFDEANENMTHTSDPEANPEFYAHDINEIFSYDREILYKALTMLSELQGNIEKMYME
ncbi:MAG: hypothetical protein WC444_04555 [Candidatus Paceibacterota bacterium]